MKKVLINKQFRIQLIVILCTTGLFFLILLIAHLTLPAQIPSDYYADDGYYIVRNTSIPARILLYLILLCFFELAAFFRAGLLSTVWKVFDSRKVWGKELLIAAVFGAAGALAARAMFSLTGKEPKEFWMLSAALLLIFFEIQIRLLFRKTPVRESEDDRTVYSGILIGAAVILSIMILFEWLDCGSKAPEYTFSGHYIFPIVLFFAEAVLAALLLRKYLLNAADGEKRYQRMFLLLIFFLATAYMLILLPFVSPDEDAHFLSAYRLSDLFLGRICRFGDARLMMRAEDYRFFSDAQLTNSAQYFAQITDNSHLFLQEPGLVVTEAAMVTNAVTAYIPAAIGMTAARLLGLSATILFYFGRLGNIAFGTAVAAHVMKIIGKKRAAFFVLMAFPMMLHLLGSYSYDAGIFCFCALFVSQIMKIYSMEGVAPFREKLLLILYGALLAPCKLVYLPVLFIALILPSEKLGEGRRGIFWKIMIIACGLAAAAVMTKGVAWMTTSSAVQSISSGGNGVRILSWCQEEGYTLPILLSDIPRVVRILIHSALYAFDEYFFTMIGARLGWLDISIPFVCLIVSFLLFFLSAHIKEERTAVLSFGQKDWITILCLLSAVLIFLAMLLSWTPLSYEIVAGVQGRYFLPLLIPFLWFPGGRTIRVGPEFQTFLIPAEGMLHIWILAYIYLHTIIAG